MPEQDRHRVLITADLSCYANKELDLDPVSDGEPLKVKETHAEFCVLLYSLLW